MLSVGMVSASESVSKDLNVNDGNEHLTNQVSTDVEILSDSGSTATFTDLDNDIKNAKDGVVTLTKDYKYDSGKDGKFKSGVQIYDIVINGNNHTLDGSGFARIFSQYSGSVTLNNIKFINGYVPDKTHGGAYLLSSGNLVVNNCQFENNYAGQHGGAIGVASITRTNPVEIYDSRFINNSAKFNGGSLYLNNVSAVNCYFEGNRILTRAATDFTLIEQKGLGGAIFAADSNIRKSLFKNNYVLNSGHYQIEEGGGAIASIRNLTVDDCTFDNNFALKGGAIFGIAQFSSDLNPRNRIHVYNSRFVNNDADSGGAICSNFNTTVDRSVFNNNSASGYGGGAINTGFKSNDNVFTNSNFTNNLAYNYGGAISSSHSKVRNCLFENNEANHGGAIFSLSFSVSNSKFKNNLGTLGNETIVVVDKIDIDSKTKVSKNEIQVFDQNKVSDYSVDVLNGAPGNTKVIPSGKFAGYEVYCVEQHLFYPDNTEGVLVKDLTYISNSLDRTVVGEYIRILFYLKEAYPEKYAAYSEYDIQDIIWLFTDGNYARSPDRFIRDIIAAYNSHSIEFNDTTYFLPNGTKMEYDMQIFLTPTDRQNMVLFKSQPFVPRFNETVTKETLNTTVLAGEDVQFRITVLNTGNMPLERVFVNDTQYSKGLVYKSWFSEKGKWKYNKNGVWVLQENLTVGEKASFVIVFSTHALGNLTNNVTSGYLNITLSNSTNKTTTLANPNMTVEKITNNEVVRVGQEVSFTIIVRNTGEYEITGIFVIDDKYSKGLVYDYFVDETNLWKYRGNHRWDYTRPLGVGEQASITLFFLTTRTGLLYNSVIAGNNQTNVTKNNTNHTNVTKLIHKNRTKTPDDNHTKNKTNITNITKIHKHHEKRVRDKNATGNPLYALIFALISLGVSTSRRKK